MNKKTLFFLTNVPVWAIILSYTSMLIYRIIPAESISLVIIKIIDMPLWLFISFYLFYSFLVPKYFVKGKSLVFWILVIVYIFIAGPLLIEIIQAFLHWIFFGSSIIKFIFSYKLMDLHIWLSIWLVYSSHMLLCAFLGILCRLAFDSSINLQQKRELENKNLMSEIKIIKSKLNPHLLFNTLNNIDTLIQKDPVQASASLSKLSDLLRYVVYDTENELISIEKEIESIIKYIDLEKIRLANPAAIVFSSEILDEVYIPPMIFFPFIENGFKHSNLNDSNNKLQIQISSKNGKILFSCINTINKMRKKMGNSGVGLDLAKKRLTLLFPSKHKLIINENNNVFSVFLEIDLNK